MLSDSLYQEVILDHARSPRGYGLLEVEHQHIHQENPSCGDQLDLQLIVGEDDRIQAIAFQGHGCVISQASASMMTEVIEGKTIAEAEEIMAQFSGMMTGDSTIDPEDLPGDLPALQGVKRFPVRVRCATLAWHALDALLEAHKS